MTISLCDEKELLGLGLGMPSHRTRMAVLRLFVVLGVGVWCLVSGVEERGGSGWTKHCGTRLINVISVHIPV